MPSNNNGKEWIKVGTSNEQRENNSKVTNDSNSKYKDLSAKEVLSESHQKNIVDQEVHSDILIGGLLKSDGEDSSKPRASSKANHVTGNGNKTHSSNTKRSVSVHIKRKSAMKNAGCEDKKSNLSGNLKNKKLCDEVENYSYGCNTVANVKVKNGSHNIVNLSRFRMKMMMEESDDDTNGINSSLNSDARIVNTDNEETAIGRKRRSLSMEEGETGQKKKKVEKMKELEPVRIQFTKMIKDALAGDDVNGEVAATAKSLATKVEGEIFDRCKEAGKKI